MTYVAKKIKIGMFWMFKFSIFVVFSKHFCEVFIMLIGWILQGVSGPSSPVSGLNQNRSATLGRPKQVSECTQYTLYKMYNALYKIVHAG